MSFIQIIYINKKKRYEHKCDECNNLYLLQFKKEKLTFCSRHCLNLSRKNGKIRDQTKLTCLERYGVDHNFKSKEVQEKFKQTCLKKYGVDNPNKSKQVREKIEQTCLKKYGVKNSFQSKEVKEKSKRTLIEHYGVDHQMKSTKVKDKIKKTCLDRYGFDNPMKSKNIQEKSKQTCLKRYGVENVSLSKEINEKRKETFLERYGVNNPWKSKEIQEKFKQTCLKRYGVDNPSKSSIIQSKINQKEKSRKCHETMKLNGTYGKSKAEDKFYELLCSKFGKENIERSIIINNWSIDFYVKAIKTYIQFDGVYWHGLDRQVKMIKEFKNSRDKAIYKTRLRDQEQNEWFKVNNLKLMRFTDTQFKTLPFDQILQIVTNPGSFEAA